MSEIVKGNYDLPDAPRLDDGDQAKSLTRAFEEATLAKVGGSICFVMKTDTFLWTGDDQGDS